MKAREIKEVDLNHWVPGSQFFQTDDGKSFIVDSDTQEYPQSIHTFIRRNTLVFYCNDDATVTDMTPDFVFDPGTTAEEAIANMGYELEEA